MNRTTLYLLTLAILLASLGLSLGLTYLPCHSAICVEQFFPYNTRIHISTYHASLLALFLALTARLLSPPLHSLLSTHLSPRPIPFLTARLSLGGLLATIWLAHLALAAPLAYYIPDQLSFYRSRALTAAGTTLGTTRLAAVGVSGHVCDVLVGLTLLPIARTSVLPAVFGLAPSSLLRFHMLVAYALAAAVVVHAGLFYAWVPVFAHADEKLKGVFAIDNPTVSQPEAEKSVYAQSVLASGMLALVVLVAVVVTSLPGARRRRYNTFYLTHLLTALFFVLVCLHASTDFYMLLPGLVLWCLDWSLRIRGLVRVVDAAGGAEGRGWWRVVVPGRAGGAATKEVDRTAGWPLMTWYLCVPAVSRWEVHPFTAAGTGENGGDVVFLWRVPDVGKKEKKVAREWTARVARLIEEGEAGREEGVGVEMGVVGRRGGGAEEQRGPMVGLKVRLEGPYAAQLAPFENYAAVLCVVGGTGVSGALALAQSWLRARKRAGAADTVATERFGIVWSLRESDDTDLVDVQAILSQAAADEMPFLFTKHLTGPGKQRLDFSRSIGQFMEWSGESNKTTPSSTWVYLSGPAKFMVTGETACVGFRQSHSKSPQSLDWYCARWDV